MPSALLPLVALLAALATPPIPLLAQSTKAELFGVIRDPRSLPVQGASVALRNTATGLKLSLLSGSEGTYNFFALSAGTYTIEVAKQGFAGLQRGGLVLRVGDRLSLDLDLTLGEVSQAVEVTVAAPLLQASRGTVSFLVE